MLSFSHILLCSLLYRSQEEVESELKQFKALSDKFPISPRSTFLVEQRCAAVMKALGYERTVDALIAGESAGGAGGSNHGGGFGGGYGGSPPEGPNLKLGMNGGKSRLRYVERGSRRHALHLARKEARMAAKEARLAGRTNVTIDWNLVEASAGVGDLAAAGAMPMEPVLLLRHTLEPAFHWCAVRLGGAEPIQRFFVRLSAPDATSTPLCFPDGPTDRCPSRVYGAKSWHRNQWGGYPMEVAPIETPPTPNATFGRRLARQRGSAKAAAKAAKAARRAAKAARNGTALESGGSSTRSGGRGDGGEGAAVNASISNQSTEARLPRKRGAAKAAAKAAKAAAKAAKAARRAAAKATRNGTSVAKSRGRNSTRASSMRPGAKAAVYNGTRPFTFAFVRNPYDRLVSAYERHIAAQDKGTSIHRAWIRELHALGDREVITFSHFVRWVAQQDGGVMHHAWQPFTSQCGFGREGGAGPTYDFIGRLENLQSDFAHVMRALGLVTAEHRRLWEQVSSKSAPALSLGGADRALRLHHYYQSDDANDLIGLVQRKYARDLSMFGYTYPGNSSAEGAPEWQQREVASRSG